MWHVWPGQLWPALPDQELRFSGMLRDRAEPAAFSRDDVSSLVGILRCGGDLDAAVRFAPGLNLSALRGAFDAVEGQLQACQRAWDAIVHDPSAATLIEHADSASLLMPVPVHRMLYALEESPEVLRAVVRTLQEKIDDMTRAARAFEHELRSVVPPSPMGIDIGSRLFSATSAGVYGDPFFLTDRVSALSPVRLADLLTRCDVVPD